MTLILNIWCGLLLKKEWEIRDIMTTITKEEFDNAYGKDPYLKDRWSYFSKVIEILNEEKPVTVLELGSCGGAAPFTMIKESDTFDIRKDLYDNLTYEWDATRTPWPIENNKYDMFIALQVWEHLGQKQVEAFKEVMRISRSAILSFPYMWNCPKDVHHMIDDKKIAEWTLNIRPKSVTRGGCRMIYFFKF